MIDIHSHILHGILDSPADISISLEIVRQYMTTGFTCVVSTPHYNPSSEDIDSFLSKCKYKYRELSEAMNRQKLHLSIVPGAEVMLCPELLKIRGISRICINHSEYMLVEFPWHHYPIWAQSVLFELRLRNIIPILAHPERNKWISNNYKNFIKLIDAGLLLQVNASSLLDKRYHSIMNKLFDDDAVSFIATDVHSPDNRIGRFSKAISKAKERYGVSRIEKILNNSLLVMKNQYPYDFVPNCSGGLSAYQDHLC